MRGCLITGWQRFVACLFAAAWLFTAANEARAIGWQPGDFLITGGPQVPSRIGVFDQNLVFKGYLEPGWTGCAGLEFDAAGNFVADSYFHSEVRIYDPSGARIGGFFNSALAASGDLRVAPDGTYIIGQGNQLGAQGAVQFTPQGSFVRQYGDGNMARTAIVAGDRLWSGRFDSPNIRVFDLATGAEGTPFSVAGLSGVDAIHYSLTTNTVLLAHPLLSRILETDLSGNVIRTLQSPSSASFNQIVRGPNDDVYATTGSRETVLRWHADGEFVGSYSMSSSVVKPSSIAWVAFVPETSTGAATVLIAIAIGGRVRGRSR